MGGDIMSNAYDAYFERIYDDFIDESETDDLGKICIETHEIFLHEMARHFYEKGKLFEIGRAHV